LIKKFYEKKDRLQIGVMVDTKRYNKNDFKSAEDDCLDFVRIAAHPDRISDTLLIAQNLYSKKYNVMLQLMDISNLSKEHFTILSEWKYKNILKTIYLADTYGSINGDDLTRIYNRIKNAGYKNISFHAHNKKGLALSNSIEAVKSGAYSIDITQDGAGINGGNLSYHELNSLSVDINRSELTDKSKLSDFKRLFS